MMNYDNLRPIRMYLTSEGVFTVYTAIPASNELFCDCGLSSRKDECVHVRRLRKRLAMGVGLPLEFEKKLSTDEMRALIDGPLPAYKAFFVRYGAIEAM
jgi:hypothetical protein